ncbi:MAG: hypothetical protein IKA25_00175 [Alphaproteobacteria bacterium]|nr:hypothetical protein [Alphaproteobacteria bacterium]MBQ7289581.1 hypothetical protein [Alphaproteobacteria bacterium]MBR1953479.1 hypothetical protein [Alphaproteobacteria bacterium]
MKQKLICLTVVLLMVSDAAAGVYGCVAASEPIPAQSSRCSGMDWNLLSSNYPYWQYGDVVAGFAKCVGGSSVTCTCRQIWPYFNAMGEWTANASSINSQCSASTTSLSDCYTNCARACLASIADNYITWGYNDTGNRYELQNILSYSVFYK